MLPQFTRQGVLPPGDYPMTIEELRTSFLVSGPKGVGRGWDADWRLKLVNNLEILAKQLWSIGVKEIYINGSFTEDRDRPNDIDGYFVCSVSDQVNRVVEKKLNQIDPFKAWGWDEHIRHPGRRLPLWLRYHVVLWPYAPGTMFGCDDLGNPLEMSQAFRRTKFKGIAKGIIRLEESGTRP